MYQNKNNNTTAMNADDTAPLQTDSRPTGAYGDNQRYTEQNPAYPPQGQQQSDPTGRYGSNSGPTPAANPTQRSQGQHGLGNIDYGAGGGSLGHTQQGDNQRYTERNPAYQPQGQQQFDPTGQYGFNSGSTPAAGSTRPSQGPGYGAGGGTFGHTQQDGTQIQQPIPQTGHQQGLNSGPAFYDSTHPSQGPGYGAGGGTLGHAQQDDTQINQGQYGSAPPTSLTNFSHGAPGAGQRVGDPAIPPANNINPNSTNDWGSPLLKRTVGKVEFAVGSMVGSNSLKTRGLQKKKEANAVEIQALEISEAERLEQEALMRRERAVIHGAHPAHSVLGGPQRTHN